jgi:hypothetical protein
VEPIDLDSIRWMHGVQTMYEPPRQLQLVLDALSKAGGAQLIMVTGGPALGKSSLAQDVCMRVACANPDGRLSNKVRSAQLRSTICTINTRLVPCPCTKTHQMRLQNR